MHIIWFSNRKTCKRFIFGIQVTTGAYNFCKKRLFLQNMKYSTKWHLLYPDYVCIIYPQTKWIFIVTIRTKIDGCKLQYRDDNYDRLSILIRV